LDIWVEWVGLDWTSKSEKLEIWEDGERPNISEVVISGVDCDRPAIGGVGDGLRFKGLS
jgi:hypothetical protein